MAPNLVRVYLRVVARDMAGNQGFDETADPILVDLTEPEAKILGISSGVRATLRRRRSVGTQKIQGARLH